MSVILPPRTVETVPEGICSRCLHEGVVVRKWLFHTPTGAPLQAPFIITRTEAAGFHEWLYTFTKALGKHRPVVGTYIPACADCEPLLAPIVELVRASIAERKLETA